MLFFYFVWGMGGIKDKSQEDLCFYSTDGLFSFEKVSLHDLKN